MRRLKRQYKRPRRPWNTTQITEERKLLNTYGLRRKRELWRAREILRQFRKRARTATAREDKEAEQVLLKRLQRIGMLSDEKECTIDHVLALSIENILDRRLQTIILKRGMATTMKQARQFITHGHVAIDGRRVLYPSFLVRLDAEDKIDWTTGKPPTILEASKKRVLPPAPKKNAPKAEGKKEKPVQKQEAAPAAQPTETVPAPVKEAHA
ncbi:MAG: 30S ribosomal protein S4 [Nanoarchaeota archaeon]|nr:30S ribosomal protein S4 [Nanoarchaeota archaeon]